MDDDDAGPRSLFLVVCYDSYAYKGDFKRPYFCSILQLETEETPQDENELIETDFSVKFSHPEPPPQYPLPIVWFVSPLASSTEGDLYLVPECHWGINKYEERLPLHGCIYNLRSKECKRIQAPHASKYGSHAVTMKGHVYYLSFPWVEHLSGPDFGRYDPLSGRWDKLEPAPFLSRLITATAVLDNTILFNISTNDIWAYYLPNNKWYHVIVHDFRAYSIIGEAVVLGNTIYALEEDCFNLILVFSLVINKDLEFQFSLVSTIFVSGMEEIEVEDKDVHWYSDHKHLAYLGKDNFCLVRSCLLLSPKEYQSIQVINMKLQGENLMTVKNTRFYNLKLEGKKKFNVRCCFSLPKGKTPALEEGKPSVVKFDPFPMYTGQRLKRKVDTDRYRDLAEEETTEHGNKSNSLHFLRSIRWDTISG